MSRVEPPKQLTGEKLAEAVHVFLETQVGKQYLQSLSLKYNELHHQAESESLTIEQKALRVERAAGVKWAIDWMTERQQRFLSGFWNGPVEDDDEA